MKHKIFGLSLLGLSSVALVFGSGCSVGGNGSEDARAQQARDAKILQDLYSSVQGVWEGTVSNQNPKAGLAPFQAELKLFVSFSIDGTNPDGSTRLRPVLRGRFQPKDFVAETDMTMLTGDYDRNGRILLSGTVASSTGAATGSSTGGSSTGTTTTQVFSIAGAVRGDQMTVEVSRPGGVWGYFEAVRTTSDASAPAEGEAKEFSDRYKRIYQPFQGRYFGQFESVDGNNYNASISLEVTKETTGTGVSAPKLTAVFRRLDHPAGEREWLLSVDFNMQTGTISMRETGLSGGVGLPSGFVRAIEGTLKAVGGKKVMELTVRDRSSELGSITATLN